MDTTNNLNKKIAVIGAGAVGSTVAYTLMVKNLASEILLIDINKEKVEGEVLDICDGLSFSETQNVKVGNYKDVADGYKMIGNAVPVQFAYNIAKKIFSDLSKIRIKSSYISFGKIKEKEKVTS